ncbi:hypothetical protein BJY59DRAFT_518563 [Rhodotorula toruloides]
MASQVTGECLVCGTETKNRCSRYLNADIDLFFCSPDHQKLVWPLHRFFCGPGKANPWEWPPLSREEADYLLEQLPISLDLSRETQASEPDAVAIHHRSQRDMKYAQLLHSMQNDIQKATIPGQGRVAFKLRATEFLYKKLPTCCTCVRGRGPGYQLTSTAFRSSHFSSSRCAGRTTKRISCLLHSTGKRQAMRLSPSFGNTSSRQNQLSRGLFSAFTRRSRRPCRSILLGS